MMARALAAFFAGMATNAILLCGLASLWLADHRETIASAWDPFAALALADPDTPVQRWKLQTAAADYAACLAALDGHGVRLRTIAAVGAGRDCSKLDAVTLTRLAGASLAPVDTRCAMALSLAVWEARSLQPAAAALLGAEVVEVLHFGGYACRKIAGGAWWSQHAVANAVDVAGFRLSDGRVVSVLGDWPVEGPTAAFLRRVRDDACGLFHVVLSPDYNAAHRDHFHLDLGALRRCR